jgi:hypothetical protein
MLYNFQEVCQLAEDKETELSDAGLVVLMSAIQHRVQLEGWTSNRVTSLLTWAQQASSMTSHNHTDRKKIQKDTRKKERIVLRLPSPTEQL